MRLVAQMLSPGRHLRCSRDRRLMRRILRTEFWSLWSESPKLFVVTEMTTCIERADTLDDENCQISAPNQRNITYLKVDGRCRKLAYPPSLFTKVGPLGILGLRHDAPFPVRIISAAGSLLPQNKLQLHLPRIYPTLQQLQHPSIIWGPYQKNRIFLTRLVHFSRTVSHPTTPQQQLPCQISICNLDISTKDLVIDLHRYFSFLCSTWREIMNIRHGAHIARVFRGRNPIALTIPHLIHHVSAFQTSNIFPATNTMRRSKSSSSGGGSSGGNNPFRHLLAVYFLLKPPY